MSAAGILLVIVGMRDARVNSTPACRNGRTRWSSYESYSANNQAPGRDIRTRFQLLMQEVQEGSLQRTQQHAGYRQQRSSSWQDSRSWYEAASISSSFAFSLDRDTSASPPRFPLFRMSQQRYIYIYKVRERKSVFQGFKDVSRRNS